MKITQEQAQSILFNATALLYDIHTRNEHGADFFERCDRCVLYTEAVVIRYEEYLSNHEESSGVNVLQIDTLEVE